MLRNTQAAYGIVSRLLHWVVALLFVIQIPLGFLTQETAERPELQFELYQWHKSTGFLLLLLAALRAVWSLSSRKPGGGEVPRLEALAARAAHTALLVLTLAVPLTGWAIASASPLQIPSYAFDLVLVPNLPLPVSDAAEAFWSQMHEWLAYGAGLLAFLHAGAAIAHAFRPGSRSLHGMLFERATNRENPARRSQNPVT